MAEQQPVRLGEGQRFGMLDCNLSGEERLGEQRSNEYGMVELEVSGERRRNTAEYAEYAVDSEPVYEQEYDHDSLF